MSIKTKLGALAAALTIAAPLALITPAQAAPHGGGMMMMGGGHHDAMHDRGHRPPNRNESRPHQPRGHYRWRAGQWNWSRDHWIWAPGIWIRF